MGTNVINTYYITIRAVGCEQLVGKAYGTCPRKAIYNYMQKLDSKYDQYFPIDCEYAGPKSELRRQELIEAKRVAKEKAKQKQIDKIMWTEGSRPLSAEEVEERGLND